MTKEIATIKVQFLSRRLLLDLHPKCLKASTSRGFENHEPISERYQSRVHSRSRHCFVFFFFDFMSITLLRFLLVFLLYSSSHTWRKWKENISIDWLCRLLMNFRLHFLLREVDDGWESMRLPENKIDELCSGFELLSICHTLRRRWAWKSNKSAAKPIKPIFDDLQWIIDSINSSRSTSSSITAASSLSRRNI